MFDVHHHIIDKKQLLTGCGSGLDNIQECAFKVVFLNRKEVVKRFYAIVETSGSEMVLFDGIVEKVMEDGLSQTNGRYLSYTVHETSSIKIFFTIQTMADYYLIAHFVNDSVLFS